jgi:3',5'-cyclic AMP phosphodiesterase CpdA
VEAGGSMKLIHLTDLHLVPHGGHLYGLDPNERLRLAITDINAQHADAAFVLITGDLAHRGEPAAYEALRGALNELKPPYHLLLGNHDNREVFRAVFPDTPVDDHGFVQRIVETPVGAFILLDTNEPGTHGGRLCRRRLGWLKDALSVCAGRSAYLAMHHPPLLLGLPCMDDIALQDPEALAAIVGGHGNIRHLFFGHVHRPVHGTWNDIPFSTHRGLNHQVALSFEPAEGIPGTHEPPSYAVIALGSANTIVHVHDFLDASPRFNLFDHEAARAASPLELKSSCAPSIQ